MERTSQEWRKIVRLAHYTRLSSTANLQEAEVQMLEKIKSILLEEHALSEDDLKKALQQYQAEVLPQKETIIRQKATDFFSDIVAELKKMKDGESVTAGTDNDMGGRLQEIIAMGGGKILKEEERKAKITHTMFYDTNQGGDNLGGHNYYFSFDK